MQSAKKYVVIFFLLCLIMGSCDTVNERLSSEDQNFRQPSFSEDWIIPKDDIIHATGLDGIVSIDDPDFAPVSDIDFVDDRRLVEGVKIEGRLRAYPHQVLDWHEIVNDRIGDTSLAMTYCPLTGTGVAWNRKNMEFGISGLLYHGNMVPYDRQTFSRYSQMQLRAVNGPMAGTRLETYPVLQTTWETWKAMYPKSEVLTSNTGQSYSYEGFAYGDEYLEENSATNFPIRNRDDRLPKKKRVHGVIGGAMVDENAGVRVYVIDRMKSGIEVIEDVFFGDEIVIVGSSERSFAISYQRTLPGGTLLQFEAVQDALPVVMKDQEGNFWDVFGYAVDGPRVGSQLTPTKSYTGYWFAWADFFPGLEIYGEED